MLVAKHSIVLIGLHMPPDARTMESRGGRIWQIKILILYTCTTGGPDLMAHMFTVIPPW